VLCGNRWQRWVRSGYGPGVRSRFGKQPGGRVDASAYARGYDLVRAATAHAIIGEVFGPVCGRMTQLGPRSWVNELADGIRATLELKPYKGGDYEFHYGVWCSWVPRFQGARLLWSRTLKQTRPCLWVNHFTFDAPPRTAMNTLLGELALRRDAERALHSLAPRAARFWQSVASVSGVLDEAQRQERRTLGNYTMHFPPPGLVTAFTMAKLGDSERAKIHLIEHGGLRDELETTMALARLDELVSGSQAT
jgi:hypothetical protein